MATDIVMPQLGESIAEGTVVKWLIPQGGAVEKDQPLLEVETEKVALDIPSPATGFLTEILVPEGTTVPVGTTLAKLDTQPASGVVNRVGGVTVRPMEAAKGERHYSPAVRQLAKEHGLDLSAITGTGEGGRVTKHDLLDMISTRESTGSVQKTLAATPSPPPASTIEEIVPLSQMRKTIAERMVLS
ncbi:MAG: E3 binding domain-containing protein, partial [Nitrospira sp.]|nr:E3 binding domain-containing protein [Nitrospira sp.]